MLQLLTQQPQMDADVDVLVAAFLHIAGSVQQVLLPAK